MSVKSVPQLSDNEGTDIQAVLSGLARAKVAFQLRALTAVLGSEADHGPAHKPGGVLSHDSGAST